MLIIFILSAAKSVICFEKLSSGQFHQHFTHAFFEQKSLWQLFSSYILALGKVQKHF
jgi:hypothetical protein